MKTTVVLLTWQRIELLRKTLKTLSDQTFKKFDVRITNANLEQSAQVDKIASLFNNNLNITVSHEGNDLKSFRRFTVGNELALSGTEAILFIDDDVTFSKHYVNNLVRAFEPHTYKSGFTWNFQNGGQNYYQQRTRRFDNEETIHYCGTGMSIIDSSIFLDNRLLEVPPEAYYIEDLWLSYFAQSVLGWGLKYVDVGPVQLGGADRHALYRQITRDKRNENVPDKSDFLRKLVKDYGWVL